MKINLRNIGAWFYALYLIRIGKIKKAKSYTFNENLITSVYSHNPSKQLFEKCVKWFIKNGYEFISVEKLKEILINENIFPSSAVIFTIDDGWKNNVSNIVTIAEKYNIPVSIFTTTQPILNGDAFWWSYIKKAHENKLIKNTVNDLKLINDENRIKILEHIKLKIKLKGDAMSEEELIKISKCKSISIGSHTITHPILTKCTDTKSKEEILESKTILENCIRKKVIQFAYPNGNYSIREINFLKESGYEIAFTTENSYINKSHKNKIYEIPRFNIPENVSFAENICRMTGVWSEKSNLVTMIKKIWA